MEAWGWGVVVGVVVVVVAGWVREVERMVTRMRVVGRLQPLTGCF
jgi:hypothetical protein